MGGHRLQCTGNSQSMVPQVWHPPQRFLYMFLLARGPLLYNASTATWQSRPDWVAFQELGSSQCWHWLRKMWPSSVAELINTSIDTNFHGSKVFGRHRAFSIHATSSDQGTHQHGPKLQRTGQREREKEVLTQCFAHFCCCLTMFSQPFPGLQPCGTMADRDRSRTFPPEPAFWRRTWRSTLNNDGSFVWWQ